MVEATAAMAQLMIITILASLALCACGSAGAHMLRYSPPAGQSHVLEVDILRQSPAGLLSARIEGESRVIEVRGDTRRVAFEVRSANVTRNGRRVMPSGALGALARMEGVELRWILDAQGRLQGQPEILGAARPDDARVHAALLANLIQASGTFPDGGVDVGATWSHPWTLQGLEEGAELDGELSSTLTAIEGGVAEITVAGYLDLPRQDLESGWTIEGEGRAQGESRLSSTTGVLLSSRLGVRVETSATSPDGVASDLTIEAELWVREPDSAVAVPADSLLACAARLAELAEPILSTTPTGEDLTFSRRAEDRIAARGGQVIDTPGVVVRLETDAAWIDGEVTDDVLLWAHDADASSGTVYLDVAPGVRLSRVAEVAAAVGAPRLLVSATVGDLDIAAFAARADASAGECLALPAAARLAAEEDLLRPGFALLHGTRSAIGSCGCDVDDLDAAIGLVADARRALIDGLRFLPLDDARLAQIVEEAPPESTASDIVRLLAAPAITPPTATEESP